MASTTTVEIKKQIEDKNYRRYVLSVTAGQEDLVVKNLQERINKQNLNDDVIEFMNPKINETSMKKGEKVVKQKKLFPGYLFFKSKMNDHIWYVVRNTPGVRLIVGAETRPVPLTDQEYEDIIRQINQSQERSDMKIPYKLGDLVMIKHGDLKGTQGVIQEIDAEKGTVVVQVEILGQNTPVIIDFDKIVLV